MKKNKIAKRRSFLAIIAIIAVIGFSMVSCDDEDSNDGPKGKKHEDGNDAYVPPAIMNELADGLYWGKPSELKPNSVRIMAIDDETEQTKVNTFWNCVITGVGKSGGEKYSATIIMDINVQGGHAAELTTQGSSTVDLYIISKAGLHFIERDDETPFTIGDGVTLILGEKITLQGKASGNVTHNPLVKILGTPDKKAEFVMLEGSVVTRNNGGGVVVSSRNGTFTMEGGVISFNKKTDEAGGGVFVEEGTFIMKKGEIRNNEAAGGGGVGVNPSGRGTFYMAGGVIYGKDDTNGGENVGNKHIGDGVPTSALFVGTGSKAERGSYASGEWKKTKDLSDSDTTVM